MMAAPRLVCCGIYAVLLWTCVLVAGEVKLIRYYMRNIRLSCPVDNASSYQSVTWYHKLKADSATSRTVWPPQGGATNEFSLNANKQLVIRQILLKHGGIYTCEISTPTSTLHGQVEVVVFETACEQSEDLPHRQLNCIINHRGPQRPLVEWYNATGDFIRSVLNSTVNYTIAELTVSSGDYVCQVSLPKANLYRKTCGNLMIIPKTTTTAPTTTVTTAPTTTVAQTTQSTTAATTMEPTTAAAMTAPPTTLPPSPAPLSTLNKEVAGVVADKHGVARAVTEMSSANFTQEGLIAFNTTTQAQTVPQDNDATLWIVIGCVLIGGILISVIIAVVLSRMVRRRKKQQDYLVNKDPEKTPPKSPVGLKYEKDGEQVTEAEAEPMMKKTDIAAEPNPEV